MRALAYDHYCDLQTPSKGAASSRRTAHTAFLAAFSRGVILIGALRKGLRLPLLRESGRLRQNEWGEYGWLVASPATTTKLIKRVVLVGSRVVCEALAFAWTLLCVRRVYGTLVFRVQGFFVGLRPQRAVFGESSLLGRVRNELQSVHTVQ